MGLALKAFAAALAPLLAIGFCQAADRGDWSATPEDAISSGRVEVKASAGELDVSAQKGSPEKLAADFKRFPSSDDWELKFKLKAASGLDEACACVVDANGEALLRAGLTPVPFMDSVEGGKAQRLWTGKRTSLKGAAQAFKLLKLGNVVSLSIDGEDQSFAAIPAEGAKSLRIEFASSGKAPASLKIEELAAEAIVPESVKHVPLVGKIPKYAFANYIGWFPVDYRSPGYFGYHDFHVIEQENSFEKQVALMHEYGWNAVLPDFLFHSPSRVGRTCELFDNFGTAIKDRNLKDFKMALFIETLTTDKKSIDEETMDNFFSGIRHVLRRQEGSPEYLKVGTRPLVFTYDSTNIKPDKFAKAFEKLRKSGCDPVFIFSFIGLQEAIYGTFDIPKHRPYFDSFEGAYNFSAGSALEKGAEIAQNIKSAYGAEFPNMIVGAAVAPGYLSTRVENRNFVSPRGTEVLRNWWRTSLASKPDFIHMTTWNDWGEATNFCPSFSVLTSRLEISQRYLCEYFQRPLPEGSPDKPESVLSYRKCLYQGEPLKFEVLPLPTLNGPASGSFSIKLLDEKGAVFEEAKSPELDLKKMEPWLWRSDKELSRNSTRLLRVKASLKLSDGRAFDYANLPDIAIAYPLSYADQLYYSVPLHKMADASKGISLAVNGSTEPCVATDGLNAIECFPKGAGASLQAAISKDGHALRLLAPLDRRGSEMRDDEREGTIQLKPLAPGEPSAWADWNKSDGCGNDSYSALASFPDGTWAYSPTVWTEPAFKHGEVSAQWVFMPQSAKEQDSIRDLSGNGFDFKRPEKDLWSFVKLPGNGRAMSFNGADSRLFVKPNTALPNGQCSVEAILRFDAIGKEQSIVYQRGAQLSLLIDKSGYLVARRLPEKREHPNPFVEVRSKAPLSPKSFHQIVARFDSKNISLHVDGQLQGSAPCEGTRSCEVFVVGGPASTAPEVSKEIDCLEPDAFLKGEIVRMTLFAKALEDGEIKAMFKRALIQPYFK